MVKINRSEPGGFLRIMEESLAAAPASVSATLTKNKMASSNFRFTVIKVFIPLEADPGSTPRTLGDYGARHG